MQFWQNQYSRNTIVLANFNADLLRGFFFEWFLCLLRQAKGICYSRSFLFVCLSLCEKCPNTELFLVCIFHIRTEYIKLRSISPYPVRMRENAEQKNSVFGHFSRSVSWSKYNWLQAFFNIFLWCSIIFYHKVGIK